MQKKRIQKLVNVEVEKKKKLLHDLILERKKAEVNTQLT
jgi:hypothetical protein